MRSPSRRSFVSVALLAGLALGIVGTIGAYDGAGHDDHARDEPDAGDDPLREA